MTLFDGTLMAAIMDMDSQNNNKDAAFVGMLKSKGRAKKWRKRASLKRASGAGIEDGDEEDPESKFNGQKCCIIIGPSAAGLVSKLCTCPSKFLPCRV